MYMLVCLCYNELEHEILKEEHILMKKILSIVLCTLLLIGLFPANVSATTSSEIKAVWIATVNNLDYPKVKNSENAQKEEFIKILDELQKIGINTVIVQVRAKADALYPSLINPWAESLTGKQGQDPGYDPLEFMISETHKRGMNFHAWLNPYRITTSGTDLNKLSTNHPARQNSSWVMEYKNALYYNPELKEVKDHISNTVLEIITKYNIDGIHFDDYFYPSNYPLPEGESKDGIVANLRREHVNDMVKQVSTVIKSTNSNIQFGISPIGIWKNNTSDPTGSHTGGNEGYYSVYADPRTWIKNEWIDYIVPQIYWETTHKTANYNTLVTWWSNEVKDTNVALYIGQGIYRDSVALEIKKQLTINKNHPEVKGSVYFSLKDLLANRSGCKDTIRNFYNSSSNLIEASTSDNTISSTVTGVVTVNKLNVRKGAGLEYAVIEQAAKGSKVTILDSRGKWHEVKFENGKTGWVSSDYITLNITQGSNEPFSQSQTNNYETKIVTANILNLRSTYNTHSSILAKLTKGTKESILEKQNGWYKVKLENGKIGWVSGDYVK